MKPSADFGRVSRPSRKAWIATCFRLSRFASSSIAYRWVSIACTPPDPINPMRCRVPSFFFTCPHAPVRAGLRKKLPSVMAEEMRTRSGGTTRPAPRFRWPTSLLPICPSGRPTARPDASSNVRDARSHSVCHTGVRPSSMALPSRPGRKPHPSSTTRITGGGARMLRVVVILKGMQVSQITPVLLALLGLATPQVAASQGGNRYRVNVDNAWFHQDVAGRRIARLARGAVLTGGATRNDWIQVMLDGWIFATSVGRSDRPDFDLLVTRAPNENLRAAPAGPLVAELSQGFGLKRAPPDSSGRWVHVVREGWVQRSALAPTADIVSTRTVDTSQASDSQRVLAPGPSPQAPTPIDSTRAQPVRITTLYRAPDGPEAGTVTTDTPLRVLSRNGEWTRVQFEGWVKGGDLQAAPAGVQVGVTAAELRAEPQRYVGQVLRWNLEFIAIQKADDLRPDIPSGASYVLARGPLPERGFVYVVVPDTKLPAFRALTPLVTMTITARVRNGRSRYLGNPVVDLIALEGGVTP